MRFLNVINEINQWKPYYEINGKKVNKQSSSTSFLFQNSVFKIEYVG